MALAILCRGVSRHVFPRARGLVPALSRGFADLPPHTVIPMPSLSPTMTEGTLGAWKVAEGGQIAAGDILAEIQTDKATMEMESMEDGFLAKQLVAAGTEQVAVGTPVAVMVEEEEHVAAFANYVPTAAATKEAPAPAAGEPARAITERPDLRPVGEQIKAGVPHRNSRAPPAEYAPTMTAISTPPPPGSVSMTVRDALNKALEEEMARDDKVFVIGEEVGEYQGAYKITKGLLQKFGPERVRDTPITEAGFTGLAVGAGFMGLKPVCEFMTFNFAMQSIDHIVNSAAKTLYMSAGGISCPIVFRGPNGAAAGVGAQHSQCFAAWYGSVPGLKVVAPYDSEDARGLMKAAIRDPDPVVVLENEIMYGAEFPVRPEAMDPDFTIEIGKAIIMRPGTDVTLVAFSKMVGYCLQAADVLATEGISAEVVNLRSIRPLDRDAIAESVRKTSRIVCVEEGWPQSGIGSEVAAVVMEDCFDALDAPFERVCGVDIPMPYAEKLEKAALPQVDDIVRVAKRACYRSLDAPVSASA